MKIEKLRYPTATLLILAAILFFLKDVGYDYVLFAIKQITKSNLFITLVLTILAYIVITIDFKKFK